MIMESAQFKKGIACGAAAILLSTAYATADKVSSDKYFLSLVPKKELVSMIISKPLHTLNKITLSACLARTADGKTITFPCDSNGNYINDNNEPQDFVQYPSDKNGEYKLIEKTDAHKHWKFFLAQQHYVLLGKRDGDYKELILLANNTDTFWSTIYKKTQDNPGVFGHVENTALTPVEFLSFKNIDSEINKLTSLISSCLTTIPERALKIASNLSMIIDAVEASGPVMEILDTPNSLHTIITGNVMHIVVENIMDMPGDSLKAETTKMYYEAKKEIGAVNATYMTNNYKSIVDFANQNLEQTTANNLSH